MHQEGKPIAHASKSLYSTEENYAHTVFGCKRFHEYMYRRRVIVAADHKQIGRASCRERV